MAPVPVLMVLYSSDAVEIRYSDGSCFELSPCGSTMIHQDAPNKGEHPRHGQLKKVQKRTRFVTSEHRHKAVQALDFRNRFADRSYLCEDLLPKEDIVALYAKIDSIEWPKLPDEAKIEVLPDGSRRITSLDEFATIIVSPHGHDFTVCFLSRISEDRRKTGPLSQESSSSVKSCQPSSVQTCSYEINHLSRPNKAVIRPFETTDHSELGDIGSRQLACEVDHSELATDLSEIQQLNSNVSPEIQLKLEQVRPDKLASQHVLSAEGKQETEGLDIQEIELHLKNCLYNKIDITNRSTQTDVKNNERCLTESYNKPQTQFHHTDVIPKQEKHQPSIQFASNSPGSHDISSISRSSTPDGLRTTIDSDATFIQENITEGVLEQTLVPKLRHSSPTQYTSSPYDVLGEPHSKKLERQHTNVDVSLSSSYLWNQNREGHCEQGKRDPNLKQQKQCLNSQIKKSPSSIVDVCSNTVSTDNLVLSNTVTNQHQSILQQTNKPGTIKHTTETFTDLNHNNNAKEDIRSLDISRHIHFGTAAHSNNRTTSLLTDKCSDSSQLNGEVDTENQYREQYIWTTKHCSRNECPIIWSHPLRLALEGTNLTSENLYLHPTMRRLQAMTTSAKTNDKKCICTTVPSPLPVTCPFQHNHKWTPNYKDDVDKATVLNSGEFQHGKLKIVISEGIVYRFIHRQDMAVIEIHPGDGSVLVSQGVKCHFFTHYVLVGDQLEERTYSLKSLPHNKLNGVYSVGKLIETASRFLKMNNGWEQRGLMEDIPCWKKEIIAVVEPLSSSLLEECVVEGLGKFSAFTNGRVRIVFEDRTALDMVCNFSRRVKCCLQHSQEPLVSLPCASSVSPPMPTYESIFGASTGRLLLPSGTYVTVDIKKPGPYRKYIEAAQEWAAWVGSSPLERHQFYLHLTPAALQQAAEIELKKIVCFNYILEHTMEMQQQQVKTRSSDLVTDGACTSQSVDTHEPKISSTKIQSSSHSKAAVLSRRDPQSIFIPPCRKQDLYMSAKLSHLPHRQLENSRDVWLSNQGPPISYYHQSGQDYARATSQRPEPVSLRGSAHADCVSYRKFEDTILGMESVKQILLQNSNMINDIEQFLEASRSPRE